MKSNRIIRELIGLGRVREAFISNARNKDSELKSLCVCVRNCETKYNSPLYDVFILANYVFNNSGRPNLLGELRDKINTDLKWMHKNDPSSKCECEIGLRNTAIAVALYRLSNFVLTKMNERVLAITIHEFAKRTTGVDIHPAAKIDSPFALDHGVFTVIGETAVIGKECLVLDNVKIGARFVGTTAGKTLRGIKRHPTIGDNVRIYSNARIYGDISVGDNAVIGSNTLVLEDIPASVRVVASPLIQIKIQRGRMRL